MKKVIFSLNFPIQFVIITIATEVADSGAPHVLVSADTQKSIILQQKRQFLNILEYK